MIYKYLTIGAIVSILIVSWLLFSSPQVSILNSHMPIPPKLVYKLGSRESGLVQLPDGSFMLLLIGGNKNSQKSDITESKKIIANAINGILRKKLEKK